MQATAELTIEGGYASATIPRIAERADVAPRTVSTWFPVKDDILFQGVDEAIARATSAPAATAPGDVVDRIEAWIADESSREQPDPEIFRLCRRHRPRPRAAGPHPPAPRAGPVGDRARSRPRHWSQHRTTWVRSSSPAAAMAFLDNLGSMALTPRDELSAAQVAVGFEFLRVGLASLAPARP